MVQNQQSKFLIQTDKQVMANQTEIVVVDKKGVVIDVAVTATSARRNK